MNDFGLADHVVVAIVDTVKKFSNIEDCIVFGSRAMGNFKKGSDVDLAIKYPDEQNAIADEVSAILNERLPIPYYFDIIHYEGITEVALKRHIDEFGKSLYSK